MVSCAVDDPDKSGVLVTCGNAVQDCALRVEIVLWLTSVQSFEVWVFNVFPELAALIIHGYKTAEARNTLHVYNLGSRPWVGLWANPKRMNTKETAVLKDILRDHHFLTDKEINMYTANPHDGQGNGALVALVQLGLTGPADKVQRRRLETLTETQLHSEYITLRGFEVDCKQAQTHIVEDIMTILKTRGTLAEMDAAWEREAQATANQKSTQQACKLALACSRRGVDDRYLTNILCVKMLRENGVPAADLSGMKGGKAGQGTWNVDLPVSEIDIKNMTTSQMMSLRTMPHTDMSGFYHCVPNETHTRIFV